MTGAALAAKLVTLCVLVGALLKDSTGTVTKGGQVAYSYGYVSWAALVAIVTPIMQELRIGWLWRTYLVDGVVMVELTLCDLDSRESVTGAWPAGPVNAASQALGSGSAYAKRYLFLTMTGLATADGDDDGAAATKHTRQQAAKAAKAAKVEDTRPMIDRLLSTMDAIHEADVLDRFAAQKSTTDALDGLEPLDLARFNSAVAAKRKTLASASHETAGAEDGAKNLAASAEGKKLSQRAHWWCSQQPFQRFLAERDGIEIGDAEAARLLLYERTGTDSLSALNSDPTAASIWRSLWSEFQAWRLVG